MTGRHQIDRERLALPDYQAMSPESRERVDAIYQRPVALSIENLTRVFDTPKGPITAIKDVCCTIHRRELVSIVGPSGCGKSTLIRIIAGLDYPTAGMVKVYDKPVAGPGADRGMVFQRYTLFPWLTVKGNVMFGMRRMGKDKRSAEKDAHQWIEIVGLKKFVDAYPYQLSGGMKQRVAIARALAVQPRVLLMDEPFGALDAQTRAQMQSYLLQIWRNVDVTILFITHDLEEAVYLSDRVIVLASNPGRIQELVEVPVRRPRMPEQFINPPFLTTVQHIKELIHPSSEQEELLPIPKMTADGDEVEPGAG